MTILQDLLNEFEGYYEHKRLLTEREVIDAARIFHDTVVEKRKNCEHRLKHWGKNEGMICVDCLIYWKRDKQSRLLLRVKQ